MRVAVIADVHANEPALGAVLAELAGERLDRLVCLGDVVGYNAEPAACVESVRLSADVVVAGNHDVDTVQPEPAPGTSSTARLVQRWTRSQLGAEQLSYLRELPARVEDPCGFVAVHGCYLNDTHYTGYVTSTMLDANLQAVARGSGPRVALCGHTHVPLVGWLEAGSAREVPAQGTLRWPHRCQGVLVNPGSVGQPRDGDPRAAFAILDLEAGTVEMRRVAYDVERAVAAILAAGLPRELGDRLREGR